ncbi:MAG: DUF166 domain-containing protein [Candidatus Ranarchaeia archaeon]
MRIRRIDKQPNIFLLYQGNYGRRIVEHLIGHGFARQIQGVHKFPEKLPGYIEDPRPYLPQRIPCADLIIALNIQPDLLMLLPEIARTSKASAAIIPVDSPEWLSPGLEKQLASRLSIVGVYPVFPRPFCALKKTGHPYIDAVAKAIGRPEFQISCNGDRISKVRVKKGAPCGSTWYVAKKLQGQKITDAKSIAGLALHTFPCLGSRKHDPVLKDTIIHFSARLVQDAVEKALNEQQVQKRKHRGRANQAD